MTATQALKQYARAVRQKRRAHAGVSEPALAPDFQALVTALLPMLDAVPPITVVPEFQKLGAGRPDIALVTPGQPPRAFIELKAPTKPPSPTNWRDSHDKRQFERLKELKLWAASNFVEFHLWARDEAQRSAVVVPPKALAPETGDGSADALIDTHDPQPFLDLLTTLCRATPPMATKAEELAGFLAHSARFVRSAVQERLLDDDETLGLRALKRVRETFRDVLYAKPEAGGYSSADFDELFSSAFAQTLAFGLLLVRESLSEKPGLTAERRQVGHDAWEHMPEEHPLMRAALRVLSEKEVREEFGVGFDVMRDTVNGFAPEILAIQPNGRDPIIHFYEDFLATFDPAARERYGVYYTPIEVVRYIVGAVDRVLRERLGRDGLGDETVTLLDPATGTGTFLLGVAERLRDQVQRDESGPAAGVALRGLAKRMFGFELLVGPYAVAHYRLHHALRFRQGDQEEGGEPQPVKLPRLGVYLADTLGDPHAPATIGALGAAGLPIEDERSLAHRIKTEQPILAILGNPPYRRLLGNERETLVGRWMAGGRDEGGNPVEGRWDDLKKPVSEAGKGNQLNTFEELSVAFWRWALWKLFEADNAPRRGVVAFITNRKFLTGWPYAGLRRMMRERFDRIEVIDLRGDVRAGPRGDIAGDEGVFNIMVGTAITVAIADGSKPADELAEVAYVDAWEHDRFTKKGKLAWVEAASEAGDLGSWVPVERGPLEDFRPKPFQNGEWVSLPEAFGFWKSGMKSGADPIFVAADKERLPTQVAARLAERDNPTLDISLVKRLAYRPLDSRWYYADLDLLQRPGPAMHRAWGESNVGMYSMPTGVSAGPAVWCHGFLPDYHAFRGSYGGYAFPLHDRRKGVDVSNLNPALVAALSAAYGRAVAPADVFDAILCLLSATSYTTAFAEDLEDVFPHIPFPADPATFDRAVAVGREIRAVESVARAPAKQPPSFVRLASDAEGELVLSAYADGAITIGERGTGRLTGIPRAVWDFQVSGYAVLRRWIEGRVGLPAESVYKELRDVALRIAELIHRFDEADLVLTVTLADTLSRDKLGFPCAQPEIVDAPDE